MIFQIAWRNVWRNRARSLTVICAIALGLWAGLSLISYSFGISEQRAQHMIDTQLSHIQIHHPQFPEDQKVKDTIPQSYPVLQVLQQMPNIQSISTRIKANGMCTSARAGVGVVIMGVDKEMEQSISSLDEQIVEGKFLAGIRANPIVIGKKLADKLGLSLKKKTVLTFQNASGNLAAGAFRVSGIYKSINSKYDESHVFVHIDDLQRLLQLEGQIHEIAIKVDEKAQIPEVKQQLQETYGSLLVEDYFDLAPDLRLMEESFNATLRIFMFIIMLGLAFGIINTMLMAVLERTRELGMLMAIGMNKAKLFIMILLETIFLCLIGAPVGIVLGFLTIQYFGYAGIDLRNFAEGLESLGLDPIVYLNLPSNYYLEVTVMVILTAILASIYPAIKALSLKPVEAIRHI